MTWVQSLGENPFLVFSILSGMGAAALLLRAILELKLGNSSQHNQIALSGRGQEKKWRRTVFDRITLLNRNLIQCPGCFMIDFANIRFCSRCGMQMAPHSELSRSGTHDIQAQYLVRDGPTRIVGLSIRPDAKTRIGVIVGIQNEEAAQDTTIP